MSLEGMGGIENTGSTDSSSKKVVIKKKRSLKKLTKQNDTERNIPLNTYFPGMPTNAAWEGTRDDRRDDSGVNSVEDAITVDRYNNDFSNEYIVKSGDTMWDIAESCRDTGRYDGMSVQGIVDHIADYNDIADASYIQADQKIYLPEASSSYVTVDYDDTDVEYVSDNPVTQHYAGGEKYAVTADDDRHVHQKNDWGITFGMTGGKRSHVYQEQNRGKVVALTGNDYSHVLQEHNRGNIIGGTLGDDSYVIQQYNKGDIYAGTTGSRGKIFQRHNVGNLDSETYGNYSPIYQYNNHGTSTAETYGHYSDIHNQAPLIADEITQTGRTYGYDSDVTLKGGYYGENTEQYASTTGYNSDVVMRGNVFGDDIKQEADTIFGDIDMQGNAHRGRADQYSHSVWGDQSQYNKSYDGADQVMDVEGGNGYQQSLRGDSTQQMHLNNGVGNDAFQVSGWGDDVQYMENNNHLTKTGQITGAGNDTTYYKNNGHFNQHVVKLGAGHDTANVDLSDYNVGSNITLYGNNQRDYSDSGYDRFNIDAGEAYSTRVNVNPVEASTYHGQKNDVLKLNNVVGSYKIERVHNMSGVTHLITDSQNNEFAIGEPVRTLYVNGQKIRYNHIDSMIRFFQQVQHNNQLQLLV